ncbi:MAG: glycosyltransferase family 1 protein [Candidatus Nealsonbacteria bacterium]|nr:glycosyltransferase family 1 protein [Candidatus Nealsonbacteria bacterium]
MRIGIDARLLEREMTGIGRVVAGILNCIRSLDKDNEYFLFSFGNLENYRKKGFTIIPTGRNKVIPSEVYSPIWLNFILPRYIKKNNIDLFFFPSSLIPTVNLRCKKVILLCDVFHKVNKNYHPFFYRKYLDLFLNFSIKKSNLVLTISENSKEDIINFYKVPGGKIKMVYLAAGEEFRPRLLTPEEKEYLIKKYNLPPNFILYIGIIDFRKNINAIIETADILVNREKKDVYFVLIGRPALDYKNIIKKSQKIREGHIIFLDAESKDIPFIYNLANVFFFPSFYEGFGLSPLEAMQSGTPVVASNASSLPEVIGEEGGGGGLMREPNDYQGFANDILKLSEDKNFYQEIREKGVEQAKNFSWRKTTEEIIEVFNQIYETEK